MYKYFIYGMKVCSELEIPEALEEDFKEAAEVRVKLGAFQKENYDEKQSYYFNIDNVAEYMVEKDEITINRFEGANAKLVRTYLLGSSFGYCMILRGIPALHGAGCAIYDKGVIISGESGAGKSTVSSKLRSKGYSFIADDVCAISEKDNKAHINMAYPQIKLCRDAAIKQGLDLEKLIYLNESRDKFGQRFKTGYLKSGQSFNYFFEIVLGDGEVPAFKKITGQEKMMILFKNIYRNVGFSNWGMKPEYLKKLLKIANQVEIYQIVRPRGKDTLEEVVTGIDNLVRV